MRWTCSLLLTFVFFVGCLEFSIAAKKKSGSELVHRVNDVKEFKKLLKTHTNVLVAYSKNDKGLSQVSSLLSKAADATRGIGTLVQVDCSAAKKLCKKYKAQVGSEVLLHHYSNGEFNKAYDRKVVLKSLVSFLMNPKGDMPWEEEDGAEHVRHVKGVQDFQKTISKKKVLVMFYAPWCGHCKRLKPEYAQAASALQGKAVLAGLDAELPENMAVRGHFNITGYPTLIYFESGAMKFNYGGENTKEGIIKWMKNPSEPKPPEPEKTWADETDEVSFLTAENFEAYLIDNPSTVVMFYAPWCGHCKKMKPDYEKAAKIINEEKLGKLAAVDATEQRSLGEKFEVKGYPTVKYFKNGKYEYDVDARTEEALVEFMKDPKEPPPPPEPEAAWSETESAVQHLDDATFYDALRRKKHGLVMFYAPWCGHCKKAKPEFTEAANLYKDFTKIMLAAVDCTEHSAICQELGVQGYPTIKYFTYGKNPQEYSQGRERDDFMAFLKSTSGLSPEGYRPAESEAQQAQQDSWQQEMPHVPLLNEASFSPQLQQQEHSLVMFFAPWCGHCKRAKPAFEAAAAQLTAPGQALVAVDCTVSKALCSEYKVRGFPTFKLFAGAEFSADYDLDRTTEDFVAYMNMLLKDAPQDSQQQEETTESQEQEVTQGSDETKVEL